MINDVIDTLTSLTAIMEEETQRLSGPGRYECFAEMAAAKVKLAGLLETTIAEQERTRGDWRTTLDEETRTRMLAAIGTLATAAHSNALVLARQIDLSTEMMAAVATEARRLSGTRRAIYGATGVLHRTEVATPISINASL